MRRTWQRRRSSVTWSNKPRSTSAERFEAEIRKRSCTRDKRSVHTNGSALSEIFYYSAASYLSIKRKRERERERERVRERERERGRTKKEKESAGKYAPHLATRCNARQQQRAPLYGCICARMEREHGWKANRESSGRL